MSGKTAGEGPVVYVIAGPNGSGKTTFALRFLPKMTGCRNFVNADLIARGLSPLDVDAAAVKAGRLFLMQIEEQTTAGRNFAFETTLAGMGYVRRLRAMQNKGYEIRIYYLWIPTLQLTFKRIAERVKRGGHDIPQEIASRRYYRGIKNLLHGYLPLADYCAIFDNSSIHPILVYEKTGSTEHVYAHNTYKTILKQAKETP